MCAFCIHWILCLARTISPWVICLHWVSDTDNDTVPLVSSCTCRGGLEELRDKHPAVSRPTAYSTPPFLSHPRSEYRYTFSAPLAWALWSLKTCTALTHIFLRPSCPHLLSALPSSSSSVIDGSITFWRSSTTAPLGAHNAVPGPGSCYSPAYHRLQHVPGKPSPSFHLSVSFTDTLSPSSSLFFVFSIWPCCLFPQFASSSQSSPYPSLSPTVVCGIAKMSNVGHQEEKQRHALFKHRHTNTNEGIQDTDHMIMDTIVMIISLRMLKKSHMTFPRSPIRPMQIPKVMKKPIKPWRKHKASE